MSWGQLISRLPKDWCMFRGPEPLPPESDTPTELRTWLAEVGPAVLFYHATPENGGLHILAPADIALSKANYRDAYAPHANNLVVFASTPGAGSFYLATDQAGRIIDLFGSPWDAHPAGARFPVYAGQWRVIAGSLWDLITRMTETPAEPLYWFADEC